MALRVQKAREETRMSEIVWSAYILVAGLSGVLVIDVCADLLSAQGRYDMRRHRSQR